MPKPEADTLVGFISEQQVYVQFMISMLNMVAHPRVTRVGFVEGGPQIHQHRNAMNKAWLMGDEPYLLVVDTDVVFSPEMLTQLHDSLATLPDAGGISGLLMSTVSYGVSNMFNVLSGYWNDPEGEKGYTWNSLDHIPDTVQPDMASGAGFMLLRREFVKDLGDYPYDPIPFEKEEDFRMVSPSHVMAEDIAFMYRLRKSGHPLALDPKVKPMHLKTLALRVPEQISGVKQLEDNQLWVPGSGNPVPQPFQNRAARRRAR